MNLLNEINSMLDGNREDIKQAIKRSIIRQVNKTGKLVLEINGENVTFEGKEVKAIWKDVK